MKLFSRIYGEGRPLIILHGLFGMSDNWQTQAKDFADLGFEVHVLDQRNHGQTAFSSDFSYQLMADDLLEYLQTHNIHKTYILGHSMGGKVAMVFACQHPEMVEKLIVVDIAPKGYPVHHQQILEGLHSLDFSVIHSRGAADKKLAETIPDLSVRQFLLKSLYWKEKGTLALRFNLQSLSEHIEMVGEAMAADAVFMGETLFIRGALSGYIKDTDREILKKHFPLMRLQTIENAGHWVHAEAAEEFGEVASSFLLGFYV